MSNKEILEKAIQRAIDGGWLPYFSAFDKEMSKDTILVSITEGTSDVRFDVKIRGRVLGVSTYRLEVASIIFNHDFAKALWGGGDIFMGSRYDLPGGGMFLGGELWKFHLQQMVIAEDPIKYLGSNI